MGAGYFPHGLADFTGHSLERVAQEIPVVTVPDLHFGQVYAHRLRRDLRKPPEATVLKQPVQRGVQAQFFPETPEHQVRTDMSQASGFQTPFLEALDHPDPGGKAAQGSQQDIHAAALGEFVGATQGGQNPLHGALAFPMVLHDLEIPVRPFGFDSDKHAAPPSGHRNYANLTLLLSRYKIIVPLFCRHRIFPKSESAFNKFNHLSTNNLQNLRYPTATGAA